MAEIELRGKAPAAPLRNVAALLELLQRLRDRRSHLPGLGVMYGPSGFGKSMAASVAAVEHDCVYVEVKESWTKRAFLEAVAFELGVEMGNHHYRTVAAIAGELAASKRVLLVDEADFLAAKGLLELVREIHMTSGEPVVMLGEDGLPGKIKRYERIHNRVMQGGWVPAQPANLEDARLLAQMYVASDVAVADDLLALLVERTKGRVRRIVIGLEDIRTEAVRDDIDVADRAWWGNRPFDDGDAPKRRPI